MKRVILGIVGTLGLLMLLCAGLIYFTYASMLLWFVEQRTYEYLARSGNGPEVVAQARSCVPPVVEGWKKGVYSEEEKKFLARLWVELGHNNDIAAAMGEKKLTDEDLQERVDKTKKILARHHLGAGH